MTRTQSRIALVGLFLAATICGFCAPIFRLPNNASLQFRPGNQGIYSGSGVPTLTAPIGSLYLRKDGGAGTSLYVNESGAGTWQSLFTSGALVTVPQGGTGVATLASNGVLYGNGAGAIQAATAGTADQVLVTPHAGGAPVMGQLDVSQAAAVKNQLAVANGGSGLATATAHGVLVGEGTSAFAPTAVGTTGQLLQGATGADPVWNSRPTFTAGSAIVAGTDWVASGGSIGATSTITVGTGSTDTRGSVIVTTSGAGEGANPVLTLTFHDGTFTTTPFVIGSWAGAAATTFLPTAYTASPTTLVITVTGTLVDSKVYTWNYLVLK